MEKKSDIVSKRLKELREGIHISQAKLAAIFEIEQPTVFRYEKAQSFPPYTVLMKYADYFDVSLDYIFGRTDNPQGQLYEYKPKVIFESQKMKNFIDMCFDPESPANAKLKEVLLQIMEENK